MSEASVLAAGPLSTGRGARPGRIPAGLRADRDHWIRRGHPVPALRRGFHAAVLYRAAHAARERGWRTTAWLLWLVNHGWTGADLPPSSRIGGGLYIPDPAGVVIAGAAGRDLAVGRQAVIGGLCRAPGPDIGGGPGLPVLGDGVTVEARAAVLGPVRVEDRAWIGPGEGVRRDTGRGRDAARP